MLFTKEQLDEIERRLAARSKHDTDFTPVSDIDGDDIIALVREGKNRSINGENLLSNIQSMIDADVDTQVTQLYARLANLQQQIDSIAVSGVALKQCFGTEESYGVSQKVLTSAISDIWSKIEDITGEVLKGINMTVTPSYYIGSEGCDITLSATTAEANGTFEEIEFFFNGVSKLKVKNVDEVPATIFHIDETTVIRCEAIILGEGYSRTATVVHHDAFWLGAAASYEQIMDEHHTIPIANGIRGQYDIEVSSGDNIFIIMAEGLADGFIRADINSVEIPFNRSTVTVDSKTYVVFTSVNTYIDGVYNIDING